MIAVATCITWVLSSVSGFAKMRAVNAIKHDEEVREDVDFSHIDCASRGPAPWTSRSKGAGAKAPFPYPLLELRPGNLVGEVLRWLF